MSRLPSAEDLDEVLVWLHTSHAGKSAFNVRKAPSASSPIP